MIAPTGELLRRIACGWLVSLVGGAACGAPQGASGPVGGEGAPTLLIAHVDVIDPRDGRGASDRAIAIRGDRIIGVTAAAAAPAAARTIDATGKVVIPGLWGRHADTPICPGGQGAGRGAT